LRGVGLGEIGIVKKAHGKLLAKGIVDLGAIGDIIRTGRYLGSFDSRLVNKRFSIAQGKTEVKGKVVL
jgi:hypothetical protein